MSANNAKPTPSELATLAARICPGLCQQQPARAIELALGLLEAAHEVIESRGEESNLPLTLEARHAELSVDLGRTNSHPSEALEVGMSFGAILAVVIDGMHDAERLESRLVKGNRLIEIPDGYEDVVEHELMR